VYLSKFESPLLHFISKYDVCCVCYVMMLNTCSCAGMLTIVLQAFGVFCLSFLPKPDPEGNILKQSVDWNSVLHIALVFVYNPFSFCFSRTSYYPALLKILLFISPIA